MSIYDWEANEEFDDELGEDWDWWEDERIREHNENDRLSEFMELMEVNFPKDSKERMILELEAKKLEDNNGPAN